MSNRRAHLRRIRHWIANRGVWGLVKEVLYRLRLRLQGKAQPGQQDVDTGPHPFDLAHGVDTTGLVWGESLGDANVNKDSVYWATGYYGIGPSAFTAAVERLGLPWPQYTFVDIGCGKGRALLLASRFPFRRLLGVELSPALVAIAQANLHTFNAPWQAPGSRPEAITADATTVPLPDGPLLLFLYHPFAGPVMKRFLAHVQTSARTQPRDILLLYANPELSSVLEATSGVQQLWKDYFPLTPEDSAADRFGSKGEYFSAYRVSPA